MPTETTVGIVDIIRLTTHHSLVVCFAAMGMRDVVLDGKCPYRHQTSLKNIHRLKPYVSRCATENKLWWRVKPLK